MLFNISFVGVVIILGVPPLGPSPLTQPFRLNPSSILSAVLFNPLALIHESKSLKDAGFEAYSSGLTPSSKSEMSLRP